MNRTPSLLALTVMLATACNPIAPRENRGGPTTDLLAESWPEADRLFFRNPLTPQWKGADVANSVALNPDRILWVFGDTLLAEPGANQCERLSTSSIRVHNSLAIQHGADPRSAAISHFWGQDEHGEPASFFQPEDEPDSWFWMGGVSVFQERALVFLMQARSIATVASQSPTTACAGLNFEMQGWSARMAIITDQTPDQWQWREVALPTDRYWQQILTGSSTVSVDGEYLYAWSAGPSTLGGNPVFLARWPLQQAVDADLSEPQWHTDAGWQAQTALEEERPLAIVNDGNNEISVASNLWQHASPNWWWLQSSEVVNSSLCYRNAESALGFGQCEAFIEPPELSQYPDSQLLVYAAKFHPALGGAGEDTAIATYVVNSCDLQDIRDKCDLYYPRFIKLRRHAEQGGQRHPMPRKSQGE